MELYTSTHLARLKFLDWADAKGEAARNRAAATTHIFFLIFIILSAPFFFKEDAIMQSYKKFTIFAPG